MYQLTAFIGKREVLEGLKDLPLIELKQGFNISPINSAFIECFVKCSMPLKSKWEAMNAPDDEFESLQERHKKITKTEIAFDHISRIASKGSNFGPLAYVEIDYHRQASSVWDRGNIIFTSILQKNSVNDALKVLGVNKMNSFDEFEAIDLGRYRDTERWC